MRLCGSIKILVILLADYAAAAYVVGRRAASVTVLAIVLYAWLGEYIAIFQDRTIRLKDLNDREKSRLMRVHECLAEEVKRDSGNNLSGLKMYVIPSDEINAYAYGFHNVAVTRQMLSACDDSTLCGILAHEISHILNLDAVFHRAIFANVTIALIWLTFGSWISLSLLWIVFVILCACGVCGGVFSMFIFHGLSKGIRGIFTALQHFVLFIYRAVMGLIGRGCEFRADKYSVQLGYGPELRYFLTRFAEGQESRQRTLNEILYASHPAAYKRVQRIEQYESKF